jgi:hypothetical protein
MSWSYREKVSRLVIRVFKENGNVPVWFNDLQSHVISDNKKFVTTKMVVSVLNDRRVFETVADPKTRMWRGRYKIRDDMFGKSEDELVKTICG